MLLAGHMHPPFFKIMDEIQAGLRYVFQTSSKYTLLVSGTGHAGTHRFRALHTLCNSMILHWLPKTFVMLKDWGKCIDWITKLIGLQAWRPQLQTLLSLVRQLWLAIMAFGAHECATWLAALEVS